MGNFKSWLKSHPRTILAKEIFYARAKSLSSQLLHILAYIMHEAYPESPARRTPFPKKKNAIFIRAPKAQHTNMKREGVGEEKGSNFSPTPEEVTTGRDVWKANHLHMGSSEKICKYTPPFLSAGLPLTQTQFQELYKNRNPQLHYSSSSSGWKFTRIPNNHRINMKSLKTQKNYFIGQPISRDCYVLKVRKP